MLLLDKERFLRFRYHPLQKLRAKWVFRSMANLPIGRNESVCAVYSSCWPWQAQAAATVAPTHQDTLNPWIPIPVNTGPIPDYGTPKGTLLYDAIYLAGTEKLKNEVGRKALILITDGEDEGSTYTIKNAIEVAQKSDAIVFSIFYVDRAFYSGGGFALGGGNEGALKKISDETGGHVFTVSNKHPLNEVFKEIQEELRNQYSIGYTPTNATRDGGFRHIEIKTDNSDYHAQARAGYYATKNDAQ